MTKKTTNYKSPTKVDLVPKEAVVVWLETLKSEFPTLAFKCGTNKGANLTQALDASASLLKSSSAVLGADSLLQLLKNYARTGGKASGSSGNHKKAIAVGVVGYPNVGKSSVINSLKRSPAVKVGATAGVTRAMQEVILDKKVRLIDCPGVVFSGNSEDPSVVLRNAVKIENIKDPVTVVEKLCHGGNTSSNDDNSNNNYSSTSFCSGGVTSDAQSYIQLSQLVSHFVNVRGLNSLGGGEGKNGKGNGGEEDVEMGESQSSSGGAAEQPKNVGEFLMAVCKWRGLFKRGGIADLVKAATVVLQEVACGKFKFYKLPENTNRERFENLLKLGKQTNKTTMQTQQQVAQQQTGGEKQQTGGGGGEKDAKTMIRDAKTMFKTNEQQSSPSAATGGQQQAGGGEREGSGRKRKKTNTNAAEEFNNKRGRRRSSTRSCGGLRSMAKRKKIHWVLHRPSRKMYFPQLYEPDSLIQLPDPVQHLKHLLAVELASARFAEERLVVDQDHKIEEEKQEEEEELFEQAAGVCPDNNNPMTTPWAQRRLRRIWENSRKRLRRNLHRADMPKFGRYYFRKLLEKANRDGLFYTGNPNPQETHKNYVHGLNDKIATFRQNVRNLRREQQQQQGQQQQQQGQQQLQQDAEAGTTKNVVAEEQ